jgi:CubicO group peptidase (beta-lactamase class C family)
VSQFRILYREFLFRVVDLELIAPEGDIKKLLGQFGAILLFLSLWAGVMGLAMAGSRLAPPLRLMGVWTVEHVLISTTMLVVGLFAVLSWNSTFPDRRDVLVLTPLPIRSRTMFLAKVAAVASALGLTIVALHGPASVTWSYGIARQSAGLTAPTLIYDAELPPLDAVALQEALDRDLAAARKPGGALGPGTETGVAIGISRNGIRRVFAYGTAKPDSIFEIGSISKTFTALILAQMAAQGKVQLDDPVRSLLPPDAVNKPQGPEITLLDLATHHSGLPPMPDNLDPRDPEAMASYHDEDLYAFLRARGLARSDDPEFEYSNLGFGLLGTALAQRAGTTYAELLKREVTDPLGLHDTALALSPEQQHRLIQAYDDANRPVPPWNLGALDPAGAIRSTAGDMLTYLEAQLHPKRFGSETLADALKDTHELRAEVQDAMRIGLSWIYDPLKGIWWHNGAVSGYTSYAFFHPRGNYAGVVLLNNRGFLSSLLPDHIRQRFAGEPAVSLGNIVIPGSTGVLSYPRSLAAYWISVSAAGIFIFCCVLGLQGAAAQILPRRHFLRISSWLQLAAFCLLVAGYCLEPWPNTAFGDNSDFRLLSWLPSYWFLAVFQQLNGTLHPALAPFAHRAWLGLAIAAGSTSIGYVLSYFRTLRQIVEEPDILPGRRACGWLPSFGSPFHTAIARFSIRTILRSRQHRVIVAFYLGLGFAISILFLKSPEEQAQLLAHSGGAPWQKAAVPLLVSSVALMASWVIALRLVFAMPLELRANWIFRILPLGDAVECLAASRRTFYTLVLIPVCGIFAAVFLWLWPWPPALGHLAVLTLLSLLLVEAGLQNFRKLPFTCSYLPGKTNLNVSILFCTLLFNLIVFWWARLERNALARPDVLLEILTALALVTVWARARANQHARSEMAEVRFEEAPDPVVFALKIYKDGATPSLRPD